MCGRDMRFRALIDWGDAGWGDPALEMANLPFEAIPYVLEGYSTVSSELMGEGPRARMLWERIDCALRNLEDDPADADDLHAVLRLVGDAGGATLE